MDIKFDNSWAWVDMTVCRDIGADTTVLVIGDSWAWGDELGGSCGLRSSPVSNTEYRHSKVFGNLLSQKLNSNWVQFALPGASWAWIVLEYERLIDIVAKQSGNVIVILTMPDHCRELESGPLQYESYVHLFKDGDSIIQTLSLIEQMYYDKINDITTKYSNVKCIASPSFTQNIDPKYNQLESTWSELLGDFVKPLYLHTSGSWAVLQFLERTNQLTDQRKQEFNDVLFSRVMLCRDQMDASPMFFDRCHPTEKAHEIWAEYLYNHIKKSL